MGELTWVSSADGRTIGGGAQGPVTRRLWELFRRFTETEGEPVV